MLSETFQDANGADHTVWADNQDDLDAAVKAKQAMVAPTYPNINVPVAKGHDLTEVTPELDVNLVDGTGAHNAPLDAVNADGSTNGSGVVAANQPAELSVGEGLTDAMVADAEAKADKAAA